LFRKLFIALLAAVLAAAPLKAQQGIQFQPGEMFGNDTASARLGRAAGLKAFLDRATAVNGGAACSSTTFVRGDATCATPVPDNLGWTTYTPVVTSQTGTITAYTATGRYKQLNKTVILETDVVITTFGTASGVMIVTLPVTSAAFRYAGISFDYGGTLKSGAGYINGGTTPTFFTTADSTGNTFFGANTKVVSSFTYEVP
jgi:hypothetical protein